MATATAIDHPRPQTQAVPHPELHSGDRMDQKTFMQLYEAMPEGFRAELVGGVVIVPPPNVSADHADDHCSASGWLFNYHASTPGTRSLSGATIILGEESQPEPDGALVIRPEFGGRTTLRGIHVSGAPELVVEVSYSTDSHDIHAKKRDYEAAGIGEYVVFILHPPRRIAWFINRGGRFEPLEPGEDGLYRSEIFPGLWLDAKAAVSGDAAALLKAIQRGIESPEHAAFVETLKSRFRPEPPPSSTEIPES